MKLIYSLLIIVCFSGNAMQSQLFAQQSRFDEANALLEQSDYRDAIRLYKSIADDEYHSGALWLNMGYAYSRIDSLGVSKYYLMKAQKYPETRELAGEALDYVDNRFSRRSAVLPPLPWDRFFQSLSDSIGTGGLILWGFIFLYLATALIIGSWFRFDLRKLLRYSGFTSVSISAVFFLFALVIHYQDNRFGTGVMVDRQGAVFQQPREESSVVSTAFEGYTMRVDFKRSQDQPQWKYVRLENGMYGWIQDDRLMIF